MYKKLVNQFHRRSSSSSSSKLINGNWNNDKTYTANGSQRRILLILMIATILIVASFTICQQTKTLQFWIDPKINGSNLDWSAAELMSSIVDSLPFVTIPKTTFDHCELELTKSLKIDKPTGCGEKNGINLKLVLIVNSAIFNLDARSAIRETWGRLARQRGALLYFMLGLTEDRTIQTKVEQEDQIYGDILQGQFLDSYYNLTLKTIAMMGWIAKRCSQVGYVLKIDDDMMLNVEKAVEFVENHQHHYHRTLIGKLATNWKPHREFRNKWYVPRRAFSGKIFPNFVTGPAYLFTGDSAKPLFQTAIKDQNALYLEDVYMTGIVAERAGIQRLNNTMMRNVPIVVDQCNFGTLMTSHRYSPNDIRTIWKLVHSLSNQNCTDNQIKAKN